MSFRSNNFGGLSKNRNRSTWRWTEATATFLLLTTVKAASSFSTPMERFSSRWECVLLTFFFYILTTIFLEKPQHEWIIRIKCCFFIFFLNASDWFFVFSTLQVGKRSMFKLISAVTVGPAGEILLADSRIQVFSAKGDFSEEIYGEGRSTFDFSK